MTCRERLQMEYPDKISPGSPGGCYACPITYGYLKRPEYCKDISNLTGGRCEECWDREIPGTEEIKKENDIMPTHDINVNTKRTKAELIEEIHHAHEHIREMKAKLKNLERYKQYEDMADEMKALHTAFMNSGFSDEQAFDLMKTMLNTVAPIALRGMGL